MSAMFYGPALDSELDYRHSTLLRDAAIHRLARQARRVARTVSPQPAVTHPATPATVPATAEASAGPAGPAEHPVARAA